MEQHLTSIMCSYWLCEPDHRWDVCHYKPWGNAMNHGAGWIWEPESSNSSVTTAMGFASNKHQPNQLKQYCGMVQWQQQNSCMVNAIYRTISYTVQHGENKIFAFNTKLILYPWETYYYFLTVIHVLSQLYIGSYSKLHGQTKFISCACYISKWQSLTSARSRMLLPLSSKKPATSTWPIAAAARKGVWPFCTWGKSCTLNTHMYVHCSGTPKSFGHALKTDECTHYIRNKCIVSVYCQVGEQRNRFKFNPHCLIIPSVMNIDE